MSTQSTRLAARLMVAPSVLLLLVWMIVPLAMTLYFSFRFYRLLSPDRTGWVGFTNYTWFLNAPDFWLAIGNTLVLVLRRAGHHRRAGTLIALLIDQPVKGQGVLRILVIAPFFVMPPVAALDLGKPVHAPAERAASPPSSRGFGTQPDPVSGAIPAGLGHRDRRLGMAALRHADPADRAAIAVVRAAGGGRDGRRHRPSRGFRYIILPHLTRAITVVILIQTIFLLGIFGEIFTTTQGGPGSASTTLPYLIYKQALVAKDIGRAAAGGIIAVILANIVAYLPDARHRQESGHLKEKHHGPRRHPTPQTS